jgi:hypothetical protein
MDQLDLVQCRVGLIAGYNMAYQEDMMPVKDYWQQVIQLENARLEKKYLAEQRVELKGWKMIHDKLRSLLNSVQEGIWLRLEMDAGKLERTEIGKAMGVWTELVETKGQPNVSPGSLQKKSGRRARVKPTEVDQIIDILQDMLHGAHRIKRDIQTNLFDKSAG